MSSARSTSWSANRFAGVLVLSEAASALLPAGSVLWRHIDTFPLARCQGPKRKAADTGRLRLAEVEATQRDQHRAREAARADPVGRRPQRPIAKARAQRASGPLLTTDPWGRRRDASAPPPTARSAHSGRRARVPDPPAEGHRRGTPTPLWRLARLWRASSLGSLCPSCPAEAGEAADHHYEGHCGCARSRGRPLQVFRGDESVERTSSDSLAVAR